MLHSVTCDYCGQPAQLVEGKHALKIWECLPCDAWVTAHPQSPSDKPMGRLANAELRQAKRRAHAAFDPLWQATIDRRVREGAPSAHVRASAYKWLAAQLGIPTKDCHFAYFDLATCRRVVDICQQNTPEFMHGLRA